MNVLHSSPSKQPPFPLISNYVCHHLSTTASFQDHSKWLQYSLRSIARTLSEVMQALPCSWICCRSYEMWCTTSFGKSHQSSTYRRAASIEALSKSITTQIKISQSNTAYHSGSVPAKQFSTRDSPNCIAELPELVNGMRRALKSITQY